LTAPVVTLHASSVWLISTVSSLSRDLLWLRTAIIWSSGVSAVIGFPAPSVSSCEIVASMLRL
jgi:hypothetical protein